MEQNVEDLTSILFNSLTDLNKQSETLNEFLNAFSQTSPSELASLPASEENIINALEPNEENLSLTDSALQLDAQNVEQESFTPTDFKIDNTVKKETSPDKKITSEQPSISEDEIIDRITANIEQTLGDLSTKDNNEPSKQNIEQPKQVADKLNNFFNNLTQQAPSDNKLTTLPAKQTQTNSSTPFSLIPEKQNQSLKSDLLTLDNVQPQTEEPLQTLQEQETEQPNSLTNQQLPNSPASSTPLYDLAGSSSQPSSPLFNLKNDAATISTPSFTGYITNSYEPALEKYFLTEKANNAELTPQSISLNDIQNLQKQNNATPQSTFTQNINEYNNQTLLNTYNNSENVTQKLLSEPFQQKQNDIEQYTVEQKSIQEKEDQFRIDEPKNNNVTENITYTDNKTDFNSFDTESTESIAEYFDGIDPTLSEILQNTKQGNLVLEQIIKALPLLAAGNMMNNQQAATPAPVQSSPAPSFSMPSSMTEGRQSNLQEGVPQIPGIRNKFLVT